MSFWREGEPQPVFATGVITAGEPGTARVAELPSRNIRPIDALADLVAGTPVGSKLVTRVPSEMAYGQEGVPQANIAPDTDLVFEIEIIDTIPPFESLNARLEDGSTTDSGIDFAVLALGEGETATASDTVLTTYAGWLTDGTLFDTGTLRFSADRVIPGWTESLSDMRPGEKRVVRIPGELAYGERGAGDAIPPNATLVFYIHLRDVERLSEFLDNCEPYQAALEGRAPESEDRRPQQRRFENIRRETTGNNEDSKNTGRENE
jgi:FKBP-type peptidyl-prolyl cis-trans isomerase